MSKTMAEVLLRHWSRSTHTESEPFVDKCDGCGEVVHTWGEPTDPNERLAAHQAAALSAAGFGLVADTKAEALEEAAKECEQTSGNILNNNHALNPAWDGMAEGWKNAAVRLRVHASVIRNQS